MEIQKNIILKNGLIFVAAINNDYGDRYFYMDTGIKHITQSKKEWIDFFEKCLKELKK